MSNKTYAAVLVSSSNKPDQWYLKRSKKNKFTPVDTGDDFTDEFPDHAIIAYSASTSSEDIVGNALKTALAQGFKNPKAVVYFYNDCKDKLEPGLLTYTYSPKTDKIYAS